MNISNFTKIKIESETRHIIFHNSAVNVPFQFDNKLWKRRFRCSLRKKKRFQLVTSSSTKELNVQVTTNRETTVSDSTTTPVTRLASTLTTTFDGPFKLSHSCNKRNLEDNLSIYGNDRIMSK